MSILRCVFQRTTLAIVLVALRRLDWEEHMNSRQESPPSSQLKQILGILEQDPSNPSLLSSAALLAFDAGDLTLCQGLIERLAAVIPLAGPLRNLQGLLALAQKQFEYAIEIFTKSRDEGADDPASRFNLAWAYAMTSKWQEALDLLDDDSLAASLRGPALKIYALRHLGRLEDALVCGVFLLKRYPENQALIDELVNVERDSEKNLG